MICCDSITYTWHSSLHRASLLLVCLHACGLVHDINISYDNSICSQFTSSILFYINPIIQYSSKHHSFSSDFSSSSSFALCHYVYVCVCVCACLLACLLACLKIDLYNEQVLKSFEQLSTSQSFKRFELKSCQLQVNFLTFINMCFYFLRALLTRALLNLFIWWSLVSYSFLLSLCAAF